MLRLSIIVNMYNTAKYMTKCIESLLEQDIRNDEYEIILVDDCSSDKSVEMAEEYAQHYPNIKLYVHNSNKGLAGARNTGIDAANGKYVCFVDPDDYTEHNSFAMLLDIMDKEGLDILRFNYQKVDEKYNNIPDHVSETSFDYSRGIINGSEFLSTRLGFACYVWPYIYNLKFIKDTKCRFIEGIYLDDTPWLPRILQKAQRVDCINIRRHYYLQRNNSMVRNNAIEVVEKKRKGQIALIKILSSQKAMTDDKNVIRWYDGMISHTAYTLISLIIKYNYNHINDTITFLKEMNVFPLSTYKTTKRARLKFSMINISPKLYCLIMKFFSFRK